MTLHSLTAAVGKTRRKAFKLRPNMPAANGFKESTAGWDSLIGLWERANLLRAFLWHQQCADEKALLNQFLVRLRRFYGVDFCFGALIVDGGKLCEAAVPEAGLVRMPANFARRCFDLVAHSRAPVAWHEVSGEFSFRSTVVAPIAPPIGERLGFLLLGHSSRKGYSAVELFLLQTLASELCWVARELNGKKAHHERLGGLTHDVNNMVQLIAGNCALIRSRLSGVLDRDHEKQFSLIESNIQDILDRMNRLPTVRTSDDTTATSGGVALVDVASAVEDAIASCRSVSKERGVDVKVRSTPNTPGKITTHPAMFKSILHALVSSAVETTRNDTVECSVRRDEAGLELAVKGKPMNRVAEKVKSLFESAPQTAGGPDDNDYGLGMARTYLSSIGGDVHLRSRPGEASEFIVYLPVEGGQESHSKNSL